MALSHHQFCFQKSSHHAEIQLNNQWSASWTQGSRGTQGYADSLSYPAGREQLLCEGTVEAIKSGLAIAIVGQCPRLIVQ